MKEVEESSSHPPLYPEIGTEMCEKAVPKVQAGEKEISLIVRAADFAARKHRSQKRKDLKQTPYVNHPIGVAKILTEEANVYDPVTLAAAYLHVRLLTPFI